MTSEVIVKRKEEIPQSLFDLIFQAYSASDPLLPFVVAVSGGSLPAVLGQALSSSNAFDWNRFQYKYIHD